MTRHSSSNAVQQTPQVRPANRRGFLAPPPGSGGQQGNGRGRFNPGGPGFKHPLSDNNVDRLQRFQIIHGPRRLQFSEAEIDSRGSLAEKAL